MDNPDDTEDTPEYLNADAVPVRPEPGENKQAQTRAVSRSYSHQCGRRYASSERGTIRRLAFEGED